MSLLLDAGGLEGLKGLAAEDLTLTAESSPCFEYLGKEEKEVWSSWLDDEEDDLDNEGGGAIDEGRGDKESSPLASVCPLQKRAAAAITNSQIFRQNLSPEYDGKFYCQLDNVLDARECTLLTQAARGLCQPEAEACTLDDAVFAEQLWDRVKRFVPSTWEGRPVLGLKETVRLQRGEDEGVFNSANLQHTGSGGSVDGPSACHSLVLFLEDDSSPRQQAGCTAGSVVMYLGGTRGGGDEPCHGPEGQPRPGRVFVHEQQLTLRVTAADAAPPTTDAASPSAAVAESEGAEGETKGGVGFGRVVLVLDVLYGRHSVVECRETGETTAVCEGFTAWCGMKPAADSSGSGSGCCIS